MNKLNHGLKDSRCTGICPHFVVGIVVSASQIHGQTKRGRMAETMQNRTHKSAYGGAMIVNTLPNEDMNIRNKEINT